MCMQGFNKLKNSKLALGRGLGHGKELGLDKVEKFMFMRA